MSFLQSIQSLFSRPGARADAFSLPTTKYENAVESPGPSRRTSYNPPVAAQGPSTPTTDRYPPLSHTFHRLRSALVDTFPELIDTINHPVNPDLISSFEQQLGTPLPAPVRESFLVADGQDLDTIQVGGIFYGLYLLPLDEVINEWTFWCQVENDPSVGTNPAILATMASIPPQWVKPMYSCRGWLPLISDRSGNYIGVDLDPGPSGKWGQIIIFGRDFDRKCVLWRGEGEGGWGKWLASFVDEIESGEGYEASKVDSDEETELGYSSYHNGGSYGEAGNGLRLAGEYKGWSVLEALWDKSVKKWEGLGLGMDVAEIERGLSEARLLLGKGKSREEEREEEFEGFRADQRMASHDIPSFESPGRRTPVEGDGESLLPPSSPQASPQVPDVPRILQPEGPPSPSPASASTITPTSEHPLQDSELLSPSDRRGSRQETRETRKRNRPPPPAPAMLDLPTRADMQAVQAVAQAESSGLRGGWVMNMDTSAGAAARRSRGAHRSTLSTDSEMVDIDLEGGRQEPFGTPQMTAHDATIQKNQDELAMAGIEHRRSPGLLPLRTPSPLQPLSGRSSPSVTPKGTGSAGFATPLDSTPPQSVANVAASAIRRPPAAVDSPRSASPVTGDSSTGEIIRGVQARRPSATSGKERDMSVWSTSSGDGLLGDRPRAKVNGHTVLSDEPQSVDAIADDLEEIKL